MKLFISTTLMIVFFWLYLYEVFFRPTVVVVEEVIKYERVAVNEVSIPMTYNASELNNYCSSEWTTLKQKGWLPV